MKILLRIFCDFRPYLGYATLEKSKLRLPRFLGQAFLWSLGVQCNINVKFVVGAVLVRFNLLLICSFQKFTCLEPKTMSLKLFSDFYKILSYTDHSSMLTMQTKSEVFFPTKWPTRSSIHDIHICHLSWGPERRELETSGQREKC